MTFLPILERELRVRARSRVNYWSRTAVGLVGVLAAVPPLLLSLPFGSQAMIGRSAFTGMVTAAFLLCCAACLITSDTISGERREGTLALLLLTRVRVFDVLAGKLASNALACLLALVTFLPVLMLPLLAGGVTSAEILRKGLVLLQVLFLALSAGLWASSRGLEPRRTARDALSLLAGLVLIPEALSLLMPRFSFELLTPLGTLAHAGDIAYKTSPRPYWFSMACLQLIGWSLLEITMLNLRRNSGSFDEDFSPPDVHVDEPSHSDSFSNESTSPGASLRVKRCLYCGTKNEEHATNCYGCGTRLWVEPIPAARPILLTEQPTPIHWLLRRRRGLQPLLWLAAVIGFLYAAFGMGGRVLGIGMIFGISWTVWLVTSILTGALFASVASRFFLEARRSGELELLLTTPIAAQTIVTAQWDELKRLIRGPLLLMLIPTILYGLVYWSFRYPPYGSLSVFLHAATLLLGVVNVVVGVGAVCWLGLWFGWRTATPVRALVWTVALAKGLPYLVSLGFRLISNVFARVSPGAWWMGSVLIGLLLPQLVTLIFNCLLIWVAKTQLLLEVSGHEPRALTRVLIRGISAIGSRIHQIRQWPFPRPG